MTDHDQAARIAAMRARRGQAPVDIQVTPAAPTVPPPPAAGWTPPAAPASAGSVDMAAIAQLQTQIQQLQQQLQQRPAPTGRTAQQPKARNKANHVAAGARILATGFTASAVFGLTTVIAAANRPVAPAAVAPTDSVTATTLDPAAVAAAASTTPEIGRASCRERV